MPEHRVLVVHSQSHLELLLASRQPTNLLDVLHVPAASENYRMSLSHVDPRDALPYIHVRASCCIHRGKGSPYSITQRRFPELIPVLGSQPAGDVSHKPGGRLPLYFPPGLQLPPQPFRGLLSIGCIQRPSQSCQFFDRSRSPLCDTERVRFCRTNRRAFSMSFMYLQRRSDIRLFRHSN